MLAIIEAVLNGATPKSRNPHVPTTPNEMAMDAERCLDAGAAVVHNHSDDPALGGSGGHDAAPYLEAWRQILRERPGAISYPTMGSGGPHVTIEHRFAHHECARQGRGPWHGAGRPRLNQCGPR